MLNWIIRRIQIIAVADIWTTGGSRDHKPIVVFIERKIFGLTRSKVCRSINCMPFKLNEWDSTQNFMSKFVHNSQQLTMYPYSECSYMYVVLLESCHKNAILHIFLGITAYVAVEVTELPYAKGESHAHTLRRCMNIYEAHMTPTLNVQRYCASKVAVRSKYATE